MTVLFINGHDYTHYVADDGYDWSRDDLDSEKTKRVRSGKLRRDKITEKRNLTFKMLPMPEALAAQLDTDLHAATFNVRYRDLHGEQTREFYCSQFPAKLRQVIDKGNLLWDGITFSLHEI